jgi:hypothetical protein
MKNPFSKNSTLLLITYLFLSLNCFAQPHILFQKKEVLKIKIETNMKSLLKDRGEDPAYHLGQLSYSDDEGSDIILPIKMKVRGNFRRATENCSFPPLMLDFPQKKGKKTIFHGQDKLKLVTECRREEYVFAEYLVYQIYNLITDFSFRARLAEVTYIDSLGKRKPETAFGIFIEDEEQLAKRNAAKNFYNKNISMALLDSVDMATVALFEYLIGNNDWSVPALHNIKLMTKTGKLFIPVPYDFDHSGIVEANYALPPPQLEIANVRERLYRGLNYSPEIFQQVFDKFNSVKPQIYALYEGNPLLTEGYIKRTKRYLDEFYETINDPKAIKRYFVAGRVKN